MNKAKQTLLGLALLNLSFIAIAQESKLEFSTGVGFSYNMHTGADFVPGDTIVDYSNASSYICIPHPPYYYHNTLSYRITPLEMKIFPFSKRLFYTGFQLSFENNRESRTTPLDSILYYEPYYLPHEARYPIERNTSHKSVFISGLIGVRIKRLNIDFGAKLMFVSWRRAIVNYYETGLNKYTSNEFFLFKSGSSIIKKFQPLASISFEISESLSIRMTAYPYDYEYFAFSVGINKKFL